MQPTTKEIFQDQFMESSLSLIRFFVLFMVSETNWLGIVWPFDGSLLEFHG